jgi:iron complex outermembrane recepter protein
MLERLNQRFSKRMNAFRSEMRRKKMSESYKSLGLAMVALLLLLSSPADAYLLPEDLTELSIDALANIEVTTASRKAQRLSDSATAIFVITHEDIRRSGATSIPEALRMSPGLEVARIDGDKWAITSRGFNGRFANKLLVLMDGRSVYSPLFSGVYWDRQDTVMEDIERIEVIRGPGATMWGANAVNGVINIITKNAQQTTGGLVTVEGGNNEGAGSFRYGDRIGDTFYRAYGKYRSQGSLVTNTGRDANDSWEISRGGFRIDSVPSEQNTVTLQGDFAHSHHQAEISDPTVTPPYFERKHGAFTNQGNLLARWHHTYSSSSDLSVQAYYDWQHDGGPNARNIANIFDFDLQHRFGIGKSNDVVWGLGYRRTDGDSRGGFYFTFDPPTRKDDLFSGFLQDDILLIPDRLHLIIGSKVEFNDYTGWEVQPSIRSVWTPDSQQTVWGSVSRAVRTPSWGERNGQTVGGVIPPLTSTNPYPFPVVSTFSGQKDFVSEKLVAYELGYRFHPADTFSVDTTAFYNDYSDIRAGQYGIPYGVGTFPMYDYYVVPLFGNNRMYGNTYGAEMALDWKPTPWWRLQGSYTYLHVSLHVKPGALMVVETSDGSSPHHQFSLRSSFDITKTLEFDAWFRYAGRIRSLDVPSYLTMDLRLGWKPIPALELSAVGQNLFHRRHQEFGSADLQSGGTEIPRSFYVKGTWRF